MKSNNGVNLLNNTNEYENRKNRWICTTPNEISIFKKTMIAVSSAVFLALILLYFFREIFHYLYSELIISISSRNMEIANGISDILITEELLKVAVNIASILISIFAFTLSGLFFMFVMNGKEKDADSYISLKPRIPRNAVVLIIIGLGIVHFFSYVAAVFDITLGFFGIQKYTGNFYSFPYTAAGTIIYFFAVVVTPSIFEEILFRYLILNALHKYGNVFAIVVSSVLFGFIHASTNAFFFATALGMFSAYMTIKTKSIGFAVILHAAVNSVAFASEYLVGVLPQTDFYLANFIYIDIICAVSVITMFIFIKANKKIELPEHRNHVYIKRRTKILSFWNIISIVFFIVVILISLNDYYFQVNEFF